MVDYLEGWKDLYEVQIPLVEHPGFKEDILIRKKIDPIEPEELAIQEVYTGEDPTVPLDQPQFISDD